MSVITQSDELLETARDQAKCLVATLFKLTQDQPDGWNSFSKEVQSVLSHAFLDAIDLRSAVDLNAVENREYNGR